MKKVIILFLATCFFANESLAQSELTTFILIRHAEKGTDDPRNPSLSEEGIERAQRLKDMLSTSDITAIYSTPYKRTMDTVAPLAELKSMDVQEYNPRSMDFLNDIMKSHSGGTIIISGHSNTTPFVANALLGEKKFEQLSEKEYGKIFVVTVSEIGTGTVTLMHY